MGLWSALDGGVITVEQARAICLKTYPATIAWAQRWVQHFENRVAYERAMLDEQGGTVADKSKPEKGGAVQCWASVRGGWSYVQKVNRVSITFLDNWGNGGPNFSRTIEFDKLRAIMSAAEVEAARAAGVLYETEDKTGFILNKTPATPETRDERHTREHHEHVAAATPEASAETKAADFCAMREALKVGVQVVVAPQLFPTPPDLAARMVELANIKTGQRVCEPESGTNNIVRAIASAIDLQAIELVAIELHPALSASTALNFSAVTVRCADFLQCSAADIGTFDRIVMNPPFANAADIDHIAHALSLLNDGGELVAICANGPRQNAKLRPLIEQHGGTWEVLPAGTFEDSGTGVHAVLITVSL